MLPLVLGGAEEPALGGDAFAPRQVHAATLAPHHVLATLRRRGRAAALDAAAVAFQYPVDEDEAENEQDDLQRRLPPEVGMRQPRSVPEAPRSVESSGKNAMRPSLEDTCMSLRCKIRRFMLSPICLLKNAPSTRFLEVVSSLRPRERAT